jgi:glycosyltransferase involved in cell wall biosynthesis
MFRPTFYYPRNGMLVGGARCRVVFLIKWVAAYICAKRPGIFRILTLDPLAQEHARSRWNCYKFQVIPDSLGPEKGMPRPIGTVSAEPRRSLTLLIAGILSARKGIREVVRGLLHSPEDVRRRVILVVAGEMDQDASDYISENLQQLEEAGGNVVTDLRRITDDQLDAYIQRSDAVLTAYRGFKESSGILIRAAHFGRPVISTNEGLLGYFVRRHALGQAIDVEDSKAFATCIEAFLLTGTLRGFDPAEARRFADSSDPELFVDNYSCGVAE